MAGIAEGRARNISLDLITCRASGLTIVDSIRYVYSTMVDGAGTIRPFSKWKVHSIVVSEQFWGRAARASIDSKESGRPLNFWEKTSPCERSRPNLLSP